MRSKCSVVKQSRCASSRIISSLANTDSPPGSARVSRVGFGVSPKQSSLETKREQSSRWRDTIANTRDACATQQRALPGKSREREIWINLLRQIGNNSFFDSQHRSERNHRFDVRAKPRPRD